MPPGDVIPVLAYPDPLAAAQWLCAAFGFREHLRIGDHRVQLLVGRGSLVVTGGGAGGVENGWVMVRVADVDSHAAAAMASGARILQPPTDHPYGERQYSAEDPHGHRWTFSQSIADSNPADWGGTLVG
ncbi:MAG: glyoxalase [Gemmatimonadetes bacterium]|nr:glyoxalase [Gemmatimonadota bacterium]